MRKPYKRFRNSYGHLTRDFGAVRVVHHLALGVLRGMLFGILEPNGARKTKTIRLLQSLVEATGDAEIEVMGIAPAPQVEAFKRKKSEGNLGDIEL